MIPKTDIDILDDEIMENQPSYTYAMDLTNKRIIGNNDKLAAVKQAVYKILNTERYNTLIYSWNYGVELSSLYGKPVSFCVPEIERRIKEALLQDDRIQDVHDFTFNYPRKGVIAATFIVDSKEGTFEERKEVEI